MTEIKEVIATIEAMEKERNEAVKEANELRVKVWQLEQELKMQKEETERWRGFTQK